MPDEMVYEIKFSYETRTTKGGKAAAALNLFPNYQSFQKVRFLELWDVKCKELHHVQYRLCPIFTPTCEGDKRKNLNGNI